MAPRRLRRGTGLTSCRRDGQATKVPAALTSEVTRSIRTGATVLFPRLVRSLHMRTTTLPHDLRARHNRWGCFFPVRRVRGDSMHRPVAFFVWVLALAGVGCGGNGGNGNLTGPTGSTMFMSISPVGGATGVSTSTGIVVRFSRQMGGGMERFVDLHEGDPSGPVVAMTCGWSEDRTTLTCQPTQGLKPQAHYATHLGGGMMDADDLPVSMAPGFQMGGQWLMADMMGGNHAGMSMGMMGSGWLGSDGSYGMFFPFATE